MRVHRPRPPQECPDLSYQPGSLPTECLVHTSGGWNVATVGTAHETKDQSGSTHTAHRQATPGPKTEGQRGGSGETAGTPFPVEVQAGGRGGGCPFQSLAAPTSHRCLLERQTRTTMAAEL